ncbi:hypothetical protein [Litorihabitans aurantiacus]|uniref:Uncharacterized protein n=1 Tax=Litorihabitans aurantiacus TaxID=1930061 RepID=A0AA38CQW1_9MICO|nr:hypothetical protein [Litorihabitans aurantiacus]GMA32543.1 hypothetical protein GCM10025875_25350 [Litorihabitans aurantiacus]
MSITAIPSHSPAPARPRLRLLPAMRPETVRDVSRTSSTAHVDQDLPRPSSGRRPFDLDTVRIETDLLARRACRTVGILGTWGRSRWRAAGDAETIASTFDICVTAPTPASRWRAASATASRRTAGPAASAP